MQIKLYGYWRSSSSHRVRLALGYKGLAHESVAVNLLGGEQSSEPHGARAAHNYVPAIEIDGETFIESVAILELLDELAPEKPLYPKAAIDRARVRALVETINSGIQPLQNLNVLVRHSDDHDARTAWANHYISRGLEVFERLMERNESHGISGPFAYGSTFGAADALLIPQAFAAKRFGVDLTKLPRITRALTASANLAFVLAAAPDAQPDAPR